MADKASNEPLSDRTIKALKPTGKPRDIMAGSPPGFGVRVQGSVEKPVRTFILYTRYPGSDKPTRRAIGVYPHISLEAARAKAIRWRELIKDGKDPRAEEEEKRAEKERKAQAEVERQGNSFAVVAEEYIKRHVSKTRKAKVVAREIRQEFIARWGSKQVSEITKKDVLKVIDAAVDRDALYQAHNLLGHIRAFFNWAIDRGIYGIDTSPCDRMRPARVIGKKESRTRVLNDDEIRALWNAADVMTYPMGPLYKLLLLTGQRKSEVAEAHRYEFDLENGLWTIPAARMKAASAHLVPLPADAIALLRPVLEMDLGKGDFIFSTTFGLKPVNGFSKGKARLDAAILAELKRAAEKRGDDPERVALEPFVIHDIRRTFRSGLGSLKVPDTVAELCIAHTQKGLHKVYDLHKYQNEKREAFELWAARLRSIIKPVSGNVVEMRKHPRSHVHA